eukprot:Skav215124  [mRNA]  locus=scaffold1893:383804:399735:- [translate_table: standard]
MDIRYIASLRWPSQRERDAQLSFAKPSPRCQDPKYQHALQERDRAVEIVSAALHSTGNIIRTWVQHFDQKFVPGRNQERQIDCQKFCAGMRALRFEGDPELLFLRMDVDKIDEVTLDIIAPEAAKLWMGFRMWSVKTFADEKMMIQELSRDYGSATLDAFGSNLRRLGWTGENEEQLFQALNLYDKQDTGTRWNKGYPLALGPCAQGMQDALKLKNHAAEKRILMGKARKDFKALLKKKFGTLLRAWRTLDADDSMFMQKNELFRTVKDLCWPGDPRLLWGALDKEPTPQQFPMWISQDGSGVTTLQELDLKSAEQLAKFKQQVVEKFGDAQDSPLESAAISSPTFFQAIDVHKINKVRQHDFIEKCERFGITRADKRLFHGLDWEGKKFLTAKDRDRYGQLQGASPRRCCHRIWCSFHVDFRLRQIYPTILKAWRQLLDRDGSNVVCWEEFEQAAKRINYQGDLPGAWRYFDQDISGSISFAFHCREHVFLPLVMRLSTFKSWADEEFGGVRAAFTILDEDNSGDFNIREFIKMLRFYGFQGDCRALFSTLDCDGQGTVSLNEVSFLDLWESAPPSTPLTGRREDKRKSSARKSRVKTIEVPKKVKFPKVSPRLERLARSRYAPIQLPLLSNVASKSTLDSWASIESKVSKAKLLKSVYGRFSSTDGFFGDLGEINKAAWRNFRVKVMKEEILSGPINEDFLKSSAALNNETNSGDIGDFFKVKKKTIALRLRTMELLGKDGDGGGSLYQSNSVDSLEAQRVDP